MTLILNESEIISLFPMEDAIKASDLACSVANHASALYAKNLLALFSPLLKDGQLILNLEDELISSSLNR